MNNPGICYFFMLVSISKPVFCHFLQIILLFFPKFLTLDILAAKGLKNAIIDPMIYYWLIMAFATWGIIGFLFLMSALHIKRYFNIIPLLAVGSLFQGGVLGVAGFLIKISINLFG